MFFHLLRLLAPTLMHSPDGAPAAGGTAVQDPPAGETPPAPQPPAGGEPDPAANTGKVTFSTEQQAHIDQLIAKAHGKAKTQAEKELHSWLEEQGMDAQQRAAAEKQRAEAERDEARADALRARVETAAERAAIAAGVKADRVDRFLTVAGLNPDDLTLDGKPDPDAIKAAVEKAAGDWPEFKAIGGAPSGAPTGADFTGAGGTGKTWTRAEIDKLSPDEFEKHETEIMAQLKAGKIV